MTYAIDNTPLWTPNPATVGDTRMAQFMQAMGHGRSGAAGLQCPPFRLPA